MDSNDSNFGYFTNSSYNDRLQQWNDGIFRYLIFDVFIHCLYLVFGITGNTFVIYVYVTKLKGKETHRYFIPVLAAVDLTAIVGGSSFSITLDSLYLIYPSKFLCKIGWAICMFTTLYSVMVLLVISVQRYLLVCKPHGNQMTIFWKRISLVILTVVAAILCFPVAVFYGDKHIFNPVLNVTGVQCYIQDEYTNSTSLLIFNLTLLVLAVIVTSAFTSLYMLIGKAIYKKELQKKMRSKVTDAPCYSVTEMSASADTYLNESKSNNKLDYQSTFYIPTPKIGNGNKDGNEDFNMDTKSIQDMTLTIRHKMEAKQRMRQRVDARRFTWLFMTISIVFVIVFTPRLILVLVESLNTRFWDQVSGVERLVYTIIYRVYLIYHISNPIIYGFQDRDFKRHFKSIVCNRFKTLRINPQR